MRDIGANIRRARVRRKLTQDDLAQTVHTTRQTISNYETGRSRPDVETLQRLADTLGVELTELLDGAPSADARRAALRRLCIMGAVTLVLAGLWAYLHAVCLRQYQHGDMTPLAAMLITEPLLLCALAWTLLQALCMVTRLCKQTVQERKLLLADDHQEMLARHQLREGVLIFGTGAFEISDFIDGDPVRRNVGTSAKKRNTGLGKCV